MNKLTKTLLSFSTSAALLFSTLPSIVLAQEAPIEVIDMRHEPSNGMRYVVKLTLHSQEEGVEPRELYYLSGNTSDVTLSKITQLLKQQGVEMVGYLEYEPTKQEIREFKKTTVGELVVPVAEVTATATNLSQVTLPQPIDDILVVTELQDESPFKPTFMTVQFQDTQTQEVVAEYHALGEHDNHEAVVAKIAATFEADHAGEYTYDVQEEKVLPKESSNRKVFNTSAGEVDADPVDSVILVTKKSSDVESETSASQEVASEVSSTPSQEDMSISSSQASTSSTPESMSTAESSSSQAEDEKKLVAVKSSSTESKSDKSESNKNGKSNLPQTGEHTALFVSVLAVGLGVIGIWLGTKPTKQP